MEIVEQAKILQVIDSVFMKLPLTLMSDMEAISIKILSTNAGVIKTLPEKHKIREVYRVIVAKNNDKLFLCKVKLINVDAEGYEFYKPVKISVSSEKRLGNRLPVNDIYLTNVINQNDITKFLNDDKIQQIVKENSMRLKYFFNSFTVHIHERHDSRMRLLHSYNQPIFIPDFNHPKSIPDGFLPFVEYSRMLKGDDTPRKYRAEICIPIKYRQYATIGYVQALHKSRVDINSYNLVNLVALSLQKEFESYQNYEESKEKCRLVDIGQADLSFLHSQSKYFSKIFYLGDVILFDLYFPQHGKYTFRATIRNIRSLEKYYRIGCQFFNLSLNELEIIEQYMETKKSPI
ncbi:MAG: PilZ domain-containing protein [Spirochaetota bacterium]